jgi:HEXXH motif-containing protein
VPTGDRVEERPFSTYAVCGSDIGDVARGRAHPKLVEHLYGAERSRRLLLLQALDDHLIKAPDLVGPLTAPDKVWDLLSTAEQVSPAAIGSVLSHPYTGAWAGYVTKLLRDHIEGAGPLWMHLGYLHALAAAAAIRAGIPFAISIPVWNDGTILPTLGMARLPVGTPFAVAEVRADHDSVEITAAGTVVRLPSDHTADAPNWWGIRTLATQANELDLAIRLDDVDPYSGLFEPVPPHRVTRTEVDDWQQVLDEAWQLIVRYLPDLAAGVPTGLKSLSPRPAVPVRTLSASTGEALGSVIMARPADAMTLAVTLVHEFHHNLLSGLLHMIPLYRHDPSERFYTLWREDPRPLAGVLSGIHAFFGVTAFWRALCRHETGPLARRAGFEFAYWRGGTWRTLQALSGDRHLTEAGERFLGSIEAQLRPMLDEVVPDRMDEQAAAAAADHRAGWQLRYLRPKQTTVVKYADAWLAGLAGHELPSELEPDRDLMPTPVPDGTWHGARTDLIRVGLASGEPDPTQTASDVPNATLSDVAYLSGEYDRAIEGYLAELAEDGDRPDSWVGLGLALSAGDSNAAHALLEYPELVRAVHRAIGTQTGKPPAPIDLANWIGASCR